MDAMASQTMKRTAATGMATAIRLAKGSIFLNQIRRTSAKGMETGWGARSVARTSHCARGLPLPPASERRARADGQAAVKRRAAAA